MKKSKGIHFLISEDNYNNLRNASMMLGSSNTNLIESFIQDLHYKTELIRNLEDGEDLKAEELNSIYKFLFWYGGNLEASRKKNIAEALINQLNNLEPNQDLLEAIKDNEDKPIGNFGSSLMKYATSHLIFNPLG